ncbi:acyltransferase domain protein [Finegoldia magna SY403409CC001050417]|nr:acyltransferase domain protein [Finegoldia magna SY403409CC001050417]
MFYRFARFLMKIVFTIKYKLDIHGNTRLPETPLVICANHINLWDPILLAIIFDRPIRFMAKKNYLKIKF